MPAPPLAPVEVSETSLLVAFTRLEAKVDVALAGHGADIRELKTDRDDHEARLRVQEAKKTVSPRDLWLAVSGAIATSWILFQWVGALIPTP